MRGRLAWVGTLSRMLRRGRKKTIFGLALPVVALAAAIFALGVADPDRRGVMAAALPAGGCGSSTPATVAAVDGFVASRIYADELHGRETLQDAARVRGYAPLIRALEAHETAAVRSAVHALVYMPHWHIVRLKVLMGGHLLADVGGPYVTAPVTGVLRSHGRTLAHYVMSVQDDLGVQKLVTRFIGAPIDLYRGGAFVMGTLKPAPAAPSNGARVQVGGRTWIAHDLALASFPSGSLQASIFVPASADHASCPAVRTAAWGSVARHIAQRLQPLSGAHLQALADLLRAVTGGQLFVRSGTHRLVGGGPARIPASGTVRYAGRSWPVYSWQPKTTGPPAPRIYFLAPPG